jgi:CGNR zinc finger
MAHEKLVTIPILFEFNRPRETWKMAGGDRLAAVDFSATYARQVDPWFLREEFLKTSQSKEDVLGFLNQYGYWDSVDYLGSFWDFREWQSIIRELLIFPAAKWKQLGEKHDTKKIQRVLERNLFGLYFDCEESLPVGVVPIGSILDLLLASIYIDKITGVKFGVCKRPDCRQVFVYSSRHRRIYCEPYCGHLESLRRSRRKVKTRRV